MDERGFPCFFQQLCPQFLLYLSTVQRSRCSMQTKSSVRLVGSRVIAMMVLMISRNATKAFHTKVVEPNSVRLLANGQFIFN